MEQYQPVDGDPFAASAASLQPVFGDPFTAGSVTPESQGQAQSFVNDFANKASQTWPVRMAQGAYTAAMAPGDYMQGKISDEEAQQQAFNLAGLAMTGGVMSGVERGAGEAVLGSGPIRKVMPTDIHDVHGGEQFGTKFVMGDNGKPVAGADLSVLPDEVSINHIQTRADVQRQGHAGALVNDLFNEYPDKKIKITNTTPEGSAFFGKQFNIDDQGYITPKPWNPAMTPSHTDMMVAPDHLEPVTGDPFTPITAYHGSPHDFDAFDMSKIGTGEGAQAYGHGLYFAGNERVAQDYRNKLGAAVPHKTTMTDEDLGYYPIDDSGNPIRNPDGSIPYSHNQSEAAYNPGTMYQVQINADPNHFLDWDKPLSEQHPDVQAALKPITDQLQVKPSTIETNKNDIYHGGQWVGYAPSGNIGDMKVPQIETIARSIGGDDALRQAGIPGIKYLDAGSRNNADVLSDNLAKLVARGASQEEIDAAWLAREQAQNKPTSNYVVFDDKTIQILKKYGIGGLGIGTAAALKHFQTQPVNGDPYAGDNGG